MRLTVENIIRGDEYINYTPFVAYEYYDGIFDEMAYKLTSAGIISDNIILSRDTDDLSKKTDCKNGESFFIGGMDTYKDFIDGLDYLQERFASILEIKFKDYNGSIINIKSVTVDDELKRIVFIVE